MPEAGLVTILFTDLVGSTELTSAIGDRAADELRRAHFSHLREAIVATGGTEVKTIGDAVMVSYRGAADALAGAVAMQRAVERHNRSLDGRRLAMRIGLSAGDATFEDGDWFGTPVVEAARLCSAADGGQILTTELVRALAGSRTELTLQPLGMRELKGLTDPVSVCDVDWRLRDEATAAAIPLPGFVDILPSFPFAGRSEPLEALITAWKESLEGARRAVLVSGEPGIGKTRLVSELVRRAHQSGTTVLWGRCDEELDVPFQPFTEALRHYVHVVAPDRLRAELGALGGELTRILPDLSARIPDLADPMSSDPETERHRLFEAVTDLLAEISQSGCVILVLDDLHWADKPTLLLLRHVLRAGTPMHLLVLATYRDTDLDRTHPLSEVLADLRREPGVSRLDLDGLDADEISALMEATAGHELDESAMALARALHDETEGNPFFVGEMLRHLAESGAIVQRDGRWTSDHTLDEVGLPEGIREVVGRRLSRLSDAANRALALGAVIGAEFDLTIIEAAGGPSGDELFDALDQAVQHAIVREVPGSPGRYAFSHALVRSSLYRELTTNRRVRMHWQVACALEARDGHRAEPRLDELAYHFAEGALAGDPMKAVEYGRRAAEQADAELAFESAIGHYERALAALELMDDPDPTVQCDLQISLASALRRAGDEGVDEVVRAAAVTARTIADTHRLGRVALVLASAGAPSASEDDVLPLELLEEAVAALGDERSALAAEVTMRLAAHLQWAPETERRMELARRSLALAREAGDLEVLARVLTQSWTLCDYSQVSSVDETAALYEESLQLARETGDLRAAARSLSQLAGYRATLGDAAGYVNLEDEAVRIRDGLRQAGLAVENVQALAARMVFFGDLARAETLAEQGLVMAREAHLPGAGLGAYGAIMREVRLGQGRIGELVPLLESLVESAPGVHAWRVALTGALVEVGRVDEAREHYMWLAEDGFARVPHDAHYTVTVCGLGRVSYVIRPDDGIVADIYQRLLPFAGRFNHTGLTLSDANDIGLARTAATLGRHDDADGHFADCIELCRRVGARIKLAYAHSNWAQCLADRGAAERAREQAELALALGLEIGMDGPDGVVPRARVLLGDL